MIGIIFSWLLNTAIGRYLVGGVFIALICSVVYAGCERSARIKAEQQVELFKTAAEISQEQLKGAQEREEIRKKAAAKRGQLYEWEEKKDLDSLVDDFNVPDGVRGESRTRSSGSKSGTSSNNSYTDSSGTSYKETP